MHRYQEELTKVKKILKANPKGMTLTDISKELNINRNSVAKYLDVLLISGHVEMRSIGPAKVFFLSHRVPLSAMLNLTLEHMLVLDKESKIVSVNDNLVNLMNTKREALLGQSIEDSPHKIFTNPKIISRIKKALDGEDSTMEINFQNKEKFYFRLKFIPTTFDDGEQGVTILIRDITERKKAMEALRESEEKYRYLFENLAIGIGIADFDGNILEANEAICKITGYPYNELLKIKLMDTYVNPKDRAELLRLIKKNGVVNNFEVQLKNRKGNLYWASISVKPIKFKGKDVLLTTAIDITKQKQAEKKLKRELAKKRN